MVRLRPLVLVLAACACAKPKAGEPMTALRDFDGDGRTDIVFGSRAIDYVSTCAAHHQVTEGLDYLAHAKAGGGFSTDDDVAQQWLREQCPKKPTAFTSRKEIACGLAYGIESSTIRDKVAADCANSTGACPPPCEEGLEDALSMKVPPLLK